MKKCLIITIFIFCSELLFADSYYSKKIGIENGLSQTSVTCVDYNNNGALWIGTHFGLNQYSNGKIKSYTKEEEGGLSGSYINGIFCSSKDNSLWVASEKGLHWFDNKKGVFKPISSEPTNCILEHEDTIFFGGHHGLMHSNSATGKIDGKESPAETDILALYSYKDSLLCLDKRNGIYLYKGEIKTPLDIYEINGQTLLASCLDGDTLYLSLLGEGVITYNLKTRKATPFLGKKMKELSIVLSISKIDDNIWIGTDGNGIWVLNPGENIPVRFEDMFSTNNGTELPKAITSIFQDPFGNIWIGGERFGLTVLKSSSVRSFLTGKAINYIYESADKQKIFVGTNEDGIYSYSTDYTSKTQLRATKGMVITTIADYDKDNIIFCVYNEGFYLYDIKKGTLRRFVIVNPEINAQECLSGNAPEIYRLPDGRLIIYAINNYLYNPSDGTFSKFKVFPEGDFGSNLKSVYSYNTGNLIYSFSREGIYSINVPGLVIRKVVEYNKKLGHINCISYNGNSFVFGTDYGLYSLDTNDYSYSPIHSNLFERITEVYYDQNGTLWIGADNTLFKYENNSFFHIGENNGVAANEIRKSALSSSGSTLLAGSNGFLSISGAHTGNEDNSEKSIQLHEVNLDGKATTVHNKLLKIPYKIQDLNVTISLSDADPLEKIVYRYIVDGEAFYSIETFDDNFQVPIQKAGTYNLDVSYLRHDDKWSEPQTILYIKKMKPWFITNSAIVCYMLAFALMTSVLILYLRKKMLLELQASLEKKDQLFIHKFEEYVSQHLSENDLNVEQIAAEMAMSRASLYSKVKASFSKGIGEYIEEKRMEEAKKLLKDTKLSVADISERVGYSTTRYFSARFKVFTGMTPLAYRKLRITKSIRIE